MTKITITLHNGDKARAFEAEERLQEHSYAAVIGFLEDSLRDNTYKKSIQDNTYELARVHDAIFINGARGTGKTAFILSLKAAWENHNTDKKEADRLHFCSPIDPTLLTNDSFLSVIVGKLHDEAKRHVEKGSRNPEYYGALENLAAALESHDDQSKTVGMDKIMAHKNSIGLIGRLDEYYKQVTKALRCDAVALLIDDVDMSFKEAFKILDVIRRYLASPLVIPIVTGDYNLYAHLLNEQFHGDLVNRAPPSSHNPTADSRSLAEQYLRKVLPPHRRTQLDTVPELLAKHELAVKLGNNEVVQFNDLLSLITHLLYRRTNGKEQSHPPILPNTTRGLIQFLLRIKLLIKDIYFSVADSKEVEINTLDSEKSAREFVSRIETDKRRLAKLLGILVDYWASIEHWDNYYRTQADLWLTIPPTGIRIERPLQNIIWFNALQHPVKRATYDWNTEVTKNFFTAKNAMFGEVNRTLVAMPPLETYSMDAIFTKMAVASLKSPAARLRMSMFSYNNYYSSYQTTNMIFFGRAFEIIVTSLYEKLTTDVLKRILSDPPFHSYFSAFQTKTLDTDSGEEDDSVDPAGVTNEAIDTFIKAVDEWKIDFVTVTPSAQLVYKAMNKAFNMFVLVKTKSRMSKDSLYEVIERFRRIVLTSFASFEKNILDGDGTVVLQNVGLNKIVNPEDFNNNDPSYRFNIKPLDVRGTITHAIINHPIFKFEDADKSATENLLVRSTTRHGSDFDEDPPSDTRLKDYYKEILSEYIPDIIKTYRMPTDSTDDISDESRERIRNAIDIVINDEKATRWRGYITDGKPRIYVQLRKAAKLFGFEQDLIDWQNSPS